MTHEEEDLQIACVAWFKMQYSNILIHHSPSGGRRTVRINNKGQKYCPEGSRFKKMGVQPGFPDLQILISKRGFNNLFIELKSKTGKVSKEQKQVIEYLAQNGSYVAIINSFDDFVEKVNWYLK